MDPSTILERLSPAQAVAARYGVAPGARAAESPPLLIIAGAGSGGNVYFLVIFGDNVEEYLGRWKYLLLLVLATDTVMSGKLRLVSLVLFPHQPRL